ncbi:unnamed protein product [Ixodes pacificus]
MHDLAKFVDSFLTLNTCGYQKRLLVFFLSATGTVTSANSLRLLRGQHVLETETKQTSLP